MYHPFDAPKNHSTEPFMPPIYPFVCQLWGTVFPHRLSYPELRKKEFNIMEVLLCSALPHEGLPAQEESKGTDFENWDGHSTDAHPEDGTRYHELTGGSGA